MKLILLIIISTIFVAVGQISFSAAQKLGVNSLFNIFPIHWLALIGIISYLIGAGLFITAIKHGEVSKIFPINALSFVWVTIGGILILNESAGPLKLIAISVIITGVIFIAREK